MEESGLWGPIEATSTCAGRARRLALGARLDLDDGPPPTLTIPLFEPKRQQRPLTLALTLP